ncbi:hypothetical protein B0T19DRAFT_224044 [Cercophora scortea]|uniref:Secreted protein n=1 Tax=Cercophora scortea TaxID=314031 RepID=A0AAE0IFU4_9PEZI|nr:hypothetical protein B0T19DRAFT_224044 [Cercophora scortea]
MGTAQLFLPFFLSVLFVLRPVLLARGPKKYYIHKYIYFLPCLGVCIVDGTDRPDISPARTWSTFFPPADAPVPCATNLGCAQSKVSANRVILFNFHPLW